MGFKDIISIRDLDKSDIELILDETEKIDKELREKERLNYLEGKVVALLFFEPSTRTRLSFDTAAKRMGAETIGFSSATGTSVEKGENLADTIRTVQNYADIIVIRHKLEGAARFAAEISEKPVINAGDGGNQHPTQTLLDLYTIKYFKGRISGLKIGFVGDLKHARTVRSLFYGVSMFGVKTYLISPEELRMNPETIEEVQERFKVEVCECKNLEEVLPELDVLYVVRIQKERFLDPMEYEKVRRAYKITKEIIEEYAKEDLIILHPLPRVDEVEYDVDDLKQAKYFKQVYFGVPVRAALLKLLLG